MGAAEAAIGDNDRRLLVANYEFYRSLDTGRRSPTTPAQLHFVAVCRGTAAPETEHERAYTRFKQAVAVAGIEEAAAVAAGFVLLGAYSVGENVDDVRVADVPVRPCAGCGRPISPERLEALPEATRCVPCQQRAESASGDWQVSEVVCPRCAARGFQSRMIWRTARDPTISGYFLGCSRFPECRYVDRS